MGKHARVMGWVKGFYINITFFHSSNQIKRKIYTLSTFFLLFFNHLNTFNLWLAPPLAVGCRRWWSKKPKCTEIFQNSLVSYFWPLKHDFSLWFPKKIHQNSQNKTWLNPLKNLDLFFRSLDQNHFFTLASPCPNPIFYHWDSLEK